MTTNAQPLVHSVAGAALAAELRRIGVTHVVTVPDTMQRTLTAALEAQGDPVLVPVCTEDEAMGVNAGLYVTGHRPMLLIQNTGFYASLNTMRGIALDAQIPTFIFVGDFGRDPTKPISESPARVRFTAPTLEAWGIPYYRIDGPDDVGALDGAFAQAYERRGPVVIIIGASTA